MPRAFSSLSRDPIPTIPPRHALDSRDTRCVALFSFVSRAR